MVKFKYVVPALILAASFMAAPAVWAHEDEQCSQMHQGDHGDVEKHIKRLHDDLKVTAAQEDNWKTVAQVMRDNAESMKDMYSGKHDNHDNLTAVDVLARHSTFAQAHAVGTKKFADVFTQFYADLSDSQKKAADKLFSHHGKDHDKHGDMHEGRHDKD